jgi:hypothetical protein
MTICLLGLLLFVLPAQAELIKDQLREIASGADVVELWWQDHEWLPDYGIPKLCQRFEGRPQILQFLKAIVFERKEVWSPPPPDPAVLSIPKTNCACLGTHVILFKNGDRVIDRITYHHLSFLRSKGLNRGFDAKLSAESRTWLNRIALGGLDLETIRRIRAARKSSPIRKTPTRSTP